MLNIQKIKPIKSLLLDVDGVLTDGCVQLREDGEWVRRFNVRDGVGIKMMLDLGYDICVITGAKSGDVIKRVEFLGIPHFFKGIVDKEEIFDQYLQESGFKEEECAYIGDDIFDIPLLERVGFSASVPSAIDSAKEVASYLTTRHGGEGAVREICDLIMKHGALSKEA